MQDFNGALPLKSCDISIRRLRKRTSPCNGNDWTSPHTGSLGWMWPCHSTENVGNREKPYIYLCYVPVPSHMIQKFDHIARPPFGVPSHFAWSRNLQRAILQRIGGRRRRSGRSSRRELREALRSLPTPPMGLRPSVRRSPAFRPSSMMASCCFGCCGCRC
jgi:hypothetical protein